MEINEIITAGKRYRIIYNDGGFKPMKKEGLIIKRDGILVLMETFYGKEILNLNNLIRGEEMQENERNSFRKSKGFSGKDF